MMQAKRLTVKRTVTGLMMVFLMGCHWLPKQEEKATLKKINHEMIQGLNANQAISQHAHKEVPVAVSQALLAPSNLERVRVNVEMPKRFDVSTNKVDARNFFIGLVQDTPYNIVVHPNVTGLISLDLRQVTVKEVLEFVRNIYGYDYHFSKRGIEVFSPTLQTRAFKVNYLNVNRDGVSGTRVKSGGLNAGSSSDEGIGSSDSSSSGEDSLHSSIKTSTTTNFWTELQASIQLIIGEGEGKKIAISPLSGLVVVQAMPADLRKVQEYLDRSELSLNRQVILEAKIIEVALNDGFQSGINWSMLTGRLRASQVGSGMLGGTNVADIHGTTPGSTDSIQLTPGGGLSSLGGTFTDSSLFGGVFSLAMNYSHLASFVELLSTQGKVHVLSSPRVSTLNNQKALIKVGKDQFFVTNVQADAAISASTGSVGSAPIIPDITLESFFSGIALDVTPHISENDKVTLHVHPTISDVTEEPKTISIGGTGNSGASTTSIPLASSDIRETDTIVQAKDGQLVVIGGLMQDKRKELNGGIPVLQHLPVVGKLFQHKRYKTIKSELVILLRPMIVKNDTWNDRIEHSLDAIRRIAGDSELEEALIDKSLDFLDEKFN